MEGKGGGEDCSHFTNCRYQSQAFKEVRTATKKTKKTQNRRFSRGEDCNKKYIIQKIIIPEIFKEVKNANRHIIESVMR